MGRGLVDRLERLRKLTASYQEQIRAADAKAIGIVSMLGIVGIFIGFVAGRISDQRAWTYALAGSGFFMASLLATVATLWPRTRGLKWFKSVADVERELSEDPDASQVQECFRLNHLTHIKFWLVRGALAAMVGGYACFGGAILSAH